MPWLVVPLAGLFEQFRAPKAAFFDIMCMGIIVISLFRGLQVRYVNKYLAWLSAWVFFTIFFNWHVKVILATPKGFVFNAWTIEPTIHFMFALWATYLVISTLEKADFEKIGKALCFSATLVALVGISQWIHLNPFHGFLNYIADMHPGAFLDNPNLLGNYLCLTIPFFLYYNKPKYWAGFFIVLYGVWISKSDMSRIAAVVGIIAFILINFRSRRLVLWFVLVSIVIVTIVSFQAVEFLEWFDLEARFAGRLEVWEQAFPHFKTNPWFGQGLGKWKTFGITARTVYWIEAHNDWIERTVDIGLVGMFLFILVIVNTIRNTNFKDKLVCAYFASFISFLIIMMGSFPMEIAPVGLIGLLGFMALENMKEKET